jgi:hypothetical protein
MVGLVGAWAATSVFDATLAPSLRGWACLAGVAAFLHVPSLLEAARPHFAILLGVGAPLQFVLALQGASGPPERVGLALGVGAVLTLAQLRTTPFPAGGSLAWAVFQAGVGILLLA